MKDEYPGIDHPKSLSIREDQLLPTIDRWLGQLFDDEHIDNTIETLSNIELSDSSTHEQEEAEQTIKECDKRIANFEIACGASDDPETIAGFARMSAVRRRQEHPEWPLARFNAVFSVIATICILTGFPPWLNWTDNGAWATVHKWTGFLSIVLAVSHMWRNRRRITRLVRRSAAVV